MTWHWRQTSPVASYLVENSVGSFDLTQRIGSDGRHYYEVQPSSLSAADKAANLAIMDQQEDITRFQSRFNGAFPFSSDGVLIGLPDASFAEEMQTMITFPGGTIDLDTFHHENMHQWWGDNVSEANYNLTFFKEGMATLGEYLFAARNAATAAGGLDTAAGRTAFDASLVQQFNDNYARDDLWSGAPSNPTAYTLFSGASTYDRPGTAYLALRQILGPDHFIGALQQIQKQYGGGVITERQLEAAFSQWMPHPTSSCLGELRAFFAQWFDTNYDNTTASKPSITGPGLSGRGFPCSQ
jgi:aminopeptidase N